MDQVRYIEKSVIIHRDENGFGLRVAGHNPVFVDCVHENSAAWKAGVRKDDRIIKVNGTLVKSYDHQRVVHMIQNCQPFVNLTLHSPEPEISAPIPLPTGSLHPTDKTSNTLLNNSNINSNFVATGIKPYTLHHQIHHTHPSSASNTNWLLDIGEDLFKDTSQYHHQQQQQASANSANQSPTTSNNQTGVSKLIVSGPNPFIPKHMHLSTNNGPKSKVRHARNQSSTRDNPYYYYKSNQDNANVSIGSNAGSIASEQLAQTSRSGLSIARSRSSSSKLSTRSSTSKYKARNLRTRLVEDLRSLTITNNQVTSSSLSTSPSSSDLSDCDDQDPVNRMESSLSTSTSGGNLAQSMNSSSSGLLLSVPSTIPSKQTTRRLEIMRELIDTEKTHTERLKHLNDLLYKPIKHEGLVPLDQLKMVFSCHKTLFKIHRQIYKLLLAAQSNKSKHTNEPLIGETLVEIFDGELGMRLDRAACTFCACQATNTELLNRFTRKDTKVGEFLAQVANQQMLGRLGIKDLLASCFQRLTKYPLLLENLMKAIPSDNVGIHTKSFSDGSIAKNLASSISSSTSGSKIIPLPTSKEPETNIPNVADVAEHDEAEVIKSTATTDNNNSINNDNNNSTTKISLEITTHSAHGTSSDEFDKERLCITKALHQSRQILIHVNEAVKKAISHNKLKDIWKKTDKHPGVPAIDISTQQLLHDGPLTLRLARRSFEVYVLLLTHYLVILTRESQDKYKLKHFTAEGKLNNQLNNQFSPIFNIDEHLATRDSATDENGFYLLCKSNDDDARIYEFASPSPADRTKWKEKIHMAQFRFARVPEDDNTLTRYRELINLVSQNDNATKNPTEASQGQQQQKQQQQATGNLSADQADVSAATFVAPPSTQVSTNG